MKNKHFISENLLCQYKVLVHLLCHVASFNKPSGLGDIFADLYFYNRSKTVQKSKRSTGINCFHISLLKWHMYTEIGSLKPDGMVI